MTKKRYKNRYRLLTNDVGLCLFSMVFERARVYRFDWNKKKKVKCYAWGDSVGFPKGKYFGNEFIVEFYTKEDMMEYFDKPVKKHFITLSGSEGNGKGKIAKEN